MLLGCVSSATSPALAADADDSRALDVLALVKVENEYDGGYDRILFAEGLDVDGDGCSTRDEVILRDALVAGQVADYCRVEAGGWFSVYDGVAVTDPESLDVDHVVALKEAWQSGAWHWSATRRAAFANDLTDTRTLRAVTATSNRSKGDADPSNWLPSDTTFVCTFLADWVAIKARWSLSMDQSEAGRIRNELTDRCPDQTIDPWPPTDVWELYRSAGPPAPTTSGVLPLVALPCDPAYPGVCIASPPPDLDCADVPFRRFEVLTPDPHNFDADGNGIGCEN